MALHDGDLGSLHLPEAGLAVEDAHRVSIAMPAGGKNRDPPVSHGPYISLASRGPCVHVPDGGDLLAHEMRCGWLLDGVAVPRFFDYPSDIRRFMYTTNAIETLNSSLRQVTKK